MDIDIYHIHLTVGVWTSTIVFTGDTATCKDVTCKRYYTSLFYECN